MGELLELLEPLDTVSGREAQETTAMLLLLPQLVNQFLKPNVSMYQERPVPQLPVKFAFQFQRRNVSQYNVHPVSPLTSKYANLSQNNNVKLSKRKNVLPSQKLTASLNHVKNVFLFLTKLARLYQSRSALNSLPRNVAMSQERSVNQLSQ